MTQKQKITGIKPYDIIDYTNMTDPAFVIQTSVALLKIRYGKYLDSTAKEQLDRIERAAVKISSELSKLETN